MNREDLEDNFRKGDFIEISVPHARQPNKLFFYRGNIVKLSEDSIIVDLIENKGKVLISYDMIRTIRPSGSFAHD
jgi:hypothetical protein